MSRTGNYKYKQTQIWDSIKHLQSIRDVFNVLDAWNLDNNKINAFVKSWKSAKFICCEAITA